MRFGQSTQEQEQAVASGGSGASDWMKYLRAGDNTFQIVDEYDKWIWYWEHYNPTGYPFPCTGERDTCPGCTSENEKMRKGNRRASFNAYDGTYTNVWKVPKTVAEKLKNRYDRLGTITDRPYTITQIKNSEGRVDYDVEGGTPTQLDMETISPYLRDPEDLLVQSYEQSWGSSGKANSAPSEAKRPDPAPSTTTPKVEPQDPPSEASDVTYSEAELRAKDLISLVKICQKEGLPDVPNGINSSDDLVDWMIAVSQ